MTDPPRISVVIPAYRAAEFIGRTIRSVLGQTAPPAELIVVDDASPDDTCAAAEAAFRDARFPCRLIRSDRNSGGPTRPTNLGIAAARGDLIATLDHDDEMAPGWLAAAARAAAAAPGCGLYFGELATPPGSDRIGLLRHTADFVRTVPAREVAPGVAVIEPADAYHALARYGCFLLSWSALAFPRATWEAVGGCDEGIAICSDMAFLEAVARRAPLGRVRAPAAYWTYSPDSLFNRRRQGFWETAAIGTRIHDYYARHPLPPGLRPRLRTGLLTVAYAHVCEGRYRSGCRAYADAIRRYGLSAAAARSVGRASLRAVANQFRRGPRPA